MFLHKYIQLTAIVASFGAATSQGLNAADSRVSKWGSHDTYSSQHASTDPYDRINSEHRGESHGGRFTNASAPRTVYARPMLKVETQYYNSENHRRVDNNLNYTSIKFDEVGCSRNGLSNGEKKANQFLEKFIEEDRNIKPDNFFVELTRKIELEFSNPNEYYNMIFNCAKSLRHTKAIEGGNPNNRAEVISHLYDRDLLTVSAQLFNHCRGNTNDSHLQSQIKQTELHQNELNRVLKEKRESEVLSAKYANENNTAEDQKKRAERERRFQTSNKHENIETPQANNAMETSQQEKLLKEKLDNLLKKNSINKQGNSIN